MDYLIVDYGTSSCRASLVDVSGGIADSFRLPTSIPAEGEKAVLNVEEAWTVVVSVIRQLLLRNPGADIRAIGVSSMLGWVLLDSSGKPLGDCITWMDRRIGKHPVGDLPADEVYARTGRNPSQEIFLSKWSWLLENDPALAAATARVISLKDEIVRRLTGEVVTDIAHMNYTMLWNIGENAMDPEMLKAAKIRQDLFPPARYPYEEAGRLNADAAEATGLKSGVPVIAGSIDGTTAMYGGGMIEEGRAVLVSGTTDVLMMLMNRKPAGAEKVKILTVNNGFVPGTFAVGGATGTSGGALMKMCELLEGDCQSLITAAAALCPGAGGLLFLPGLSGERAPYWSTEISGSLAGLRMEHGPEHIIRAVLEGVAFRLRRLADEIFGSVHRPDSIFTVGGGALNDGWNKIKADALNLVFTRPAEVEATTIGTTIFCDCLMNPGSDLKTISRNWVHPGEVFPADKERAAVYEKLFGIWESYMDRNRETFKALSAIRGL